MTKRQKVSARHAIGAIFGPGDATKFITHDNIKLHDLVVLWCRVSSRQQNHTGNLDAQEWYLRNEMAIRQASVVGVVRRVGSGFWPFMVGQAAELAKQNNAKIVAVSTDRFIRHENFKTRGTDYELNARANDESLNDLQRAANGVELVTLVHPNSPLGECGGVLKQIGQQHKGRTGGRPKRKIPGYKKQWREQKLVQARRLLRAKLSIRETAECLDIGESTLRYWLRKFLADCV